MIITTLTLLTLMAFIESKVDNPVKSQSTFHEKIVLKSEFKDDMFTIDMTYANETVNILGHALSKDVKECVTHMTGFANHCVKTMQNKWPNADHTFRRIPEFYYEELNNRNFSYYYDFGAGSPLFEGFKCCIIFDILDCIHSEYKERCIGLSFAPIDEVVHLFAMQMQDKCDGYHTNNSLYSKIHESGERYHLKDKKDDRSCQKFSEKSTKNSNPFTSQTDFKLIFITIFILLHI